MSEKMLKFTKIGQQTPPKREVDTEKKILMKFMTNSYLKKQNYNLADVHNVEFLFVKFTASLSNNIPDWLKLTAEGRLQEAYQLSQSTNNMPEAL